MKNIDICCGEYASKYALTDWYEGSEEILREAMASGDDFDTGWFGCRKEIRYARIVRENGLYTVEVSSHCDDLWDGDDLIYDALWEVSKSEEELPDDIIESIRDTAADCGIDDSADEAGPCLILLLLRRSASSSGNWRSSRKPKLTTDIAACAISSKSMWST